MRMRVAVGDAADIVDEQEIELRQAGALARIVVGPQDRVVGIVEDLPEREAVVPAGIERVAGRLRRQRPAGPVEAHQAPDLGRDDEAPGLLLAQALADEVLRAPEPVHRRGVEMADARREGRLDRGAGIRQRHRRIEPAERRGAEAERRQFEAGPLSGRLSDTFIDPSPKAERFDGQGAGGGEGSRARATFGPAASPRRGMGRMRAPAGCIGLMVPPWTGCPVHVPALPVSDRCPETRSHRGVSENS